MNNAFLYHRVKCEKAIKKTNNISIMRKFFNCKIEAGFEEVSEPRLGGWNRNTDLCVDVKTILRTDRVTKLGKEYTGVLTRDGEDHYTFVETRPSTAGKRNPHGMSSLVEESEC